MEPAWCYLCLVESSGVDPRAAWGLDTADHEPDPDEAPGPMHPDQAAELRFLCAEFRYAFSTDLSEGQAAMLVHSFLDEPMSEPQERTLAWLSERAGAPMEPGLTYGRARSAIRRLVALKGLRSA